MLPGAPEPVQYPQARLLIFAKAPVPGMVKTRLIPALGTVGAAGLQQRLTGHLVEGLAASGLCPLELWVTPDTSHSLFQSLARCHGVGLRVQQGDDLGARMAHAAAQGLGRADAVVLLGTDCPWLTPQRLGQALELLAMSDAVLGPARDGGYVLLGLKRTAPSLFAGMPWGTARVAALTRRRMAGLGWHWRELPMLSDLDRPQDLDLLREDFPHLLDGRQG